MISHLSFYGQSRGAENLAHKGIVPHHDAFVNWDLIQINCLLKALSTPKGESSHCVSHKR